MLDRFLNVSFVVEAKKNPDGDGDGLYTATPGGRDITPVPTALLADERPSKGSPFRPHWTDSKEAEEYGKKWDSWRRNLSDDQSYAIKGYSNMDYEQINEAMRRGYTSNAQGAIDLIRSALDGSEIPEPLTTIRHIDPSVLQALEEGDVIEDQAFQSTSLTGSYDWPGLARLEIEVPAGAKGAYLGDAFSKVAGETELLLPPSAYEIMELMTGDDGSPVARVRLIAQDDEWFEIDDNGRIVRDAPEAKILPAKELLEVKASSKPPKRAERFVAMAKDIKVIKAARVAAYRAALKRYKK